MAGSFSLPTVLANLTAGNQPLSLIDGDFTAVYNPLVSLNTFSNFYTDTGAANAYIITVSSPQTVSQAAGLRVQFLAANANTGASTLQINALAAKNIKNLNGTALTNAQIPASSVVDVIYDGTQYLLLSASFPPFTPTFNVLSGDVALNNTANFFDGPTIAQGTTGTWWVSGSVTLKDTAGAASFAAKLWDGTTVIASGQLITQAINNTAVIALSGFIGNPVGNLRISAKDATSALGVMLFNGSGASKDSSISAIRIA